MYNLFSGNLLWTRVWFEATPSDTVIIDMVRKHENLAAAYHNRVARKVDKYCWKVVDQDVSVKIYWK